MVQTKNTDLIEISRRDFCRGVVATTAIASAPLAGLAAPSIERSELESSAETPKGVQQIFIDTNMAAIDQIMALPEFEMLYAHASSKDLENHQILLSAVGELQPTWEVKLRTDTGKIELEIVTDDGYFTVGQISSEEHGYSAFSSRGGDYYYPSNLSQPLNFVWPSNAIGRLDELRESAANDADFSKHLSIALLGTLGKDFIVPGSLD